MKKHAGGGVPKVGLVLGSGGARGWAHVGALQRLEELGVRPCCVAGTSIGAVVGAMYAAGQLGMMEDLARELDWRRVAQLFLEVNFPREGLLTGRHVMRMLRSVIPVRAISSLNMPYAAVATDLMAEREVVMQTGNLFDAIRASISIPGVFTPHKHEGTNLVDGGLVNPLPVNVCRAMGAEMVVAVDVNLGGPLPKRKRRKAEAEKKQEERPSAGIAALKGALANLMPARVTGRQVAASLSLFDVLTRTFRLVENQITRQDLERNPPDVLVQPAVGDVMTLEFFRGPDAILEGRRAVDAVAPELRRLGLATEA